MKAIIYNLSEIEQCKEQLNALNNALGSMPKSVKPKYDSEDYTYIRYHPTEDKVCLPIQLGRFKEWDKYINQSLSKQPELLSDDWNEINNNF